MPEPEAVTITVADETEIQVGNMLMLGDVGPFTVRHVEGSVITLSPTGLLERFATWLRGWWARFRWRVWYPLEDWWDARFGKPSANDYDETLD